MGGPVKIVVRTNTGIVHVQNSWTGWIGDFFDNDRFLSEDPSHLEWFLNQEMHKELGTGGFYPDGYGLVVGDMVSKTILSSQGYSTPGRQLGASISLSASGSIIGEEEGQSEVDIFNELVLAKRVDHIRWRKAGGNEQKMNVDGMSPAEIFKHFDEMESGDPYIRVYWEVIIDTTPYTVEDFGEGRSAIKTFRSRLIELDFKLTEADNEGWEEFISNTYDDEDEEYDDD